MEEKFTAEKFVKTLNQLNIWLDMVSQINHQEISVAPGCVYYMNVANKLIDLECALLAMNTMYIAKYNEYKEWKGNVEDNG